MKLLTDYKRVKKNTAKAKIKHVLKKMHQFKTFECD